MIEPSRGDIWFVDLIQTKGREQKGGRPCLVISVNEFNKGPADLIVIIPITTIERGILWHVKVPKNNGEGLEKTSYIMCENIRSISKDRLICYTGKVSKEIINSVEEKLEILLDL